jgi:hypothetical protein
MKTIRYFEVTENTEKMEGRGSTVSTGIAFSMKRDAIDFASSDRYKKYAVMGVVNPEYAKHDVKEREIIVYDDITDYDENCGEAKKLKALKKAREKLTKEELELLGLEV